MADAARNQLPSGYDEEFVNAVEEDFQCLICHLPLKEPVQTRCGHRFCNDCLEEHFRRNEDHGDPYNCPAERRELDKDRDVFPDKATERKILSFAIKCPSEGCDWTDELRNKEIHLASCLFKLVPCTNENCHVTVQRKDLEEHATITCQWRILECDHCNEPHPDCKMKDHIEQCRKFLVTCPNSCGGLFHREMIPNHTENTCPLTIISCPYEQTGCETKVQRKQVESHLQSATRLHLDLACVKLNNTEAKLNKTEVKLNNTEAKLNNTKLKLNITEVKLNVTEVKLNEAQVQLNKTEKTTKKLLEKLDTLERKFKNTEVKLSKTQEKLETTSKQVEKFDKPFVWKIDTFSSILRQARAGGKSVYDSAPFYTDRTGANGFKLKVKLYPNGDGSGKNTHLSVFIFVMKGEYDAILPWPFKKKLKFTLIDQQEDPVKRENVTLCFIPEFFARPTQEESSTGYGFPKFITLEKLCSRRYLVDDTLFLQVEIGP
ncbi:TNF receptor-associated factor 6-like [Oculina patagonica]